MRHATQRARHLVMECGMSDAVGPVYVEPEGRAASPETAKRVDAEIGRILRESYAKVTSLLVRASFSCVCACVGVCVCVCERER